MALLQELNRGGITIVVVTHEQDIAAFASRLLAFRDGQAHRRRAERAAATRRGSAAWRRRVDGSGRRPPAAARMNFLATLQVALAALRVNKLRSALTMLGIIIGVGAVITMVAVGAGAQARVEDQIRSLGSNLIIILSGNFTVGRRAAGLGLAAHDHRGRRLRARARDPGDPGRRAARCAATGRSCSATATGRRRSSASRPSTWRRASGKSSSGRAIDQAQVDSAAKVVLLGQTVARTLFGDADPVGETVRIRRVPHTVIGVLDRKGQSMIGQDQDDVVLIPISTARKRVLGGTQGQDPQRAEHHGARARRRRHGRDRAGDARPAAPAPQAAAEPGGRFLHPQPVRGAGRAGGVVEDPRAAARGHRVGVAASSAASAS